MLIVDAQTNCHVQEKFYLYRNNLHQQANFATTSQKNCVASNQNVQENVIKVNMTNNSTT